jgi:non-specific protein-tyrosine kinase
MNARHDDSLALTLLDVVRRRRRLVVLCLVLVPLAALGYSLLAPKQYDATASLLFRQSDYDKLVLGANYSAPTTDPRRDAATNATLVSLAEVSQRTADRIRGGLTAKQIQDKITVEPRGDADVVDVRARDKDPKFAVTLADTFAEQYIVFRRQADRAEIADARQLVATQLQQLRNSSGTDQEGADVAEQRATLTQQLDRLDLVISLQTGNAQLVQRARLPTVPSTPKPKRNVALGLVLGVLLGVGLALLFDRVDRRLREPQEAADIFGRPVLGTIPESRGMRGAEEEKPLDEIDAEAFRMIRASLRYFNVDRDIRSVLVTSAAPGDGKSTVVWHLASTAASLGARVLVIEADLRNPSLGRFHWSNRRTPGLSGHLAGYASFQDAIEPIPIDRPGTNGSALPGRFDVMFAGDKPPNPTDLIESERMHDLIRHAEDVYDLVLIDTPPTSIVSDAIPLVSWVSGILVVCRLGKNTRDVAGTLRDQLANLDAPVLGIVVNGVPMDTRAYYGYAGAR